MRVLAGLFLTLIAATAQAAIVYEFSGSRTAGGGDDFTGATFTLTLAAVPLIDVDFLPGAELSCNLCNHVQFVVDAVAAGNTTTPSSVVAYGVSGGPSTFLFYFEPDAFSTNGTHESIILTGLHDGVLTVSGVPLPAPFALFASALGILALRTRRNNG